MLARGVHKTAVVRLGLPVEADDAIPLLVDLLVSVVLIESVRKSITILRLADLLALVVLLDDDAANDGSQILGKDYLVVAAMCLGKRLVVPVADATEGAGLRVVAGVLKVFLVRHRRAVVKLP